MCDRLFGGDGNDVIADPDGIFAAHGGLGNDTITITFAPSWDNNTNPNDAPRSDGKITGGYGDDIITVTMNNPRFFINLKSDEPISNDPRDGNDVYISEFGLSDGVYNLTPTCSDSVRVRQQQAMGYAPPEAIALSIFKL
ncbi:hypothetical protein [Anabaena subtropica]|uniref:Uncharacterized protein n=1 Tax=Anabaena subtropica FACHB-260 TaxID=2692884 RepID=A0ABR8CVF9_9NOST|nr:hypothetical protein [Anabaena subtropica]MBD2345765.1 hypothetical protein [Anabaena subtropica FACHB-260]